MGIVILAVRRRKPSLRELQLPAQGHTAGDLKCNAAPVPLEVLRSVTVASDENIH